MTVNAFDPGLMPGSGLARDYPPLQRLAWRYLLPALRVLPGVRSTRTSGRYLAALANDARFDGVTGEYFDGLRADPVLAGLLRPRQGARPLGDQRTLCWPTRVSDGDERCAKSRPHSSFGSVRFMAPEPLDVARRRTGGPGSRSRRCS